MIDTQKKRWLGKKLGVVCRALYRHPDDPFGSVGEELLDDAQHPGDLCSRPAAAHTFFPGWMHH